MEPPRSGTIAGIQRAKSAATRAALIAAARALFGEAGYHATGTNDLVARASMTRGALYHHFADKVDLFEAVARQVAQELSHDASSAVAAMAGGPWDKVVAGLRTYLELVGSNVEAQRVLLIDGPAVLGWQRWRDLQSQIIFPGMVSALLLLMDAGVMRRRAPEPLAHLILAALNDAALTIANTPNLQDAHQAVSDALMELVRGLEWRRAPRSRKPKA